MRDPALSNPKMGPKLLLGAGLLVLLAVRLACLWSATSSDSLWSQDKNQLKDELESELVGKSVEDVVLFLEQHEAEYIQVSDDYVFCKKRIRRANDPLSYVFILRYDLWFRFENGKLVEVTIVEEFDGP